MTRVDCILKRNYYKVLVLNKSFLQISMNVIHQLIPVNNAVLIIMVALSVDVILAILSIQMD